MTFNTLSKSFFENNDTLIGTNPERFSASNVVLKDSVYVRGAGYELCTITAHDHVITGADGSTIEGFMILNDNLGSSWGYGWSESSTTIKNNVFKGHYVGLHCGQSGSNELIVNNIIIDNTNGITFGWDGAPTIRNNIIVNNNVHWYDSIPGKYEPNADIAYNNLWNATYDFDPDPATGNISVDPIFANELDNDFRLWWNSLCIDAGDPDFLYNDVDGTRNDMGVYGGPQGRTYDYAVPVELVIFDAHRSGSEVELFWSTATESNNFGFAVERQNGNSGFQKIGFIEGKGSTTEPQSYSFVDRNPHLGLNSYRLKQIDTDGLFVYSNKINVDINTPENFVLNQNYPNPFNPATKISYQLPESGNVALTVFNVLGKRIVTLIDRHQEAGYHSVVWNPDDVADGVYYYSLQFAGLSIVRKAVLVK